MPPFKGFVPKNKNKIFYQKGRKSEGKRGCAEGCGNVVNPLGFPYFHAPADKVKIELNTGVSPAIIVPVEGEENFLYMVLPVRLKSAE